MATGVHLEIEAPEVTEFYLAEGQRLGPMGIGFSHQEVLCVLTALGVGWS